MKGSGEKKLFNQIHINLPVDVIKQLLKELSAVEWIFFFQQAINMQPK